MGLYLIIYLVGAALTFHMLMCLSSKPLTKRQWMVAALLWPTVLLILALCTINEYRWRHR